jgi:hypothetical protein
VGKYKKSGIETKETSAPSSNFTWSTSSLMNTPVKIYLFSESRLSSENRGIRKGTLVRSPRKSEKSEEHFNTSYSIS